MLDIAEIIAEPGLRNRVQLFDDRFHAGELLAERLRGYKTKGDAIVLAIPTGGVQVAYIRWYGHGIRPWYNYDYNPE